MYKILNMLSIVLSILVSLLALLCNQLDVALLGVILAKMLFKDSKDLEVK